MFINQLQLLTVFCLALQVVQMNCQRPSYAGTRPGGLNQKDKYHLTQNASGAVGDVSNRFGNSDSEAAGNTPIPFGTAQQPPAGGVAVVVPQSQYQPLATPNGPQFTTLDNRFGGSSSSSSSSASSSASAGSSSTPTQAQPNLPPQQAPLPLDAHGDRDLVNYLNTVPVENRPFWFLNYQAIEAQRNGTGDKFSGAITSRGSFFG